MLTEYEQQTRCKRLTCFKCGRLLAKGYDLKGTGVIEIQCWYRQCKALNAVSLVMLDRYQREEK